MALSSSYYSKWFMLHVSKTDPGFRGIFFLVEISEKNNLFRERTDDPSCTNLSHALTFPLLIPAFPSRCPGAPFLLIWPQMPFSLLVAWPVLQGSQSTNSASITSQDGPSQTTAAAGQAESCSWAFLIWATVPCILTSANIIWWIQRTTHYRFICGIKCLLDSPFWTRGWVKHNTVTVGFSRGFQHKESKFFSWFVHFLQYQIFNICLCLLH